MCLRNTKKHSLYWWLCSILLVSLLFGSLNLGLYAGEVQEPSADEDQKNWQYWNSGYSLIKDNTQGFLTRHFGFITDNSAGASIYNDAMNTLNDAWDALTEEEKARYDNDFRYYVGYQILGDRKGESVTPTEVDVQPEAQNAFQSAINVYVQQNPLGYVGAYIYSYNFIDTSTFSYIAPYNSLKNFIKQQDGYVLVNYGSFKLNSSEHGYMIYVIPKSLNMGLYGTVTSGIFTNVQLSINWLSSQYLNQMSSEIKAYYMNESGSISEGVTNFNQWRVASIKNNNSLAFNSTNVQFTMFTNLPKNEYVYVFNTLNAYKNYNAGTPQKYYQAPSEMIDSQNTISSITGSNNSYQYITNNIQTGMTGQEVIDLVSIVMNRGSGSGSGTDDDDDNPFGFLGEIGDLIKDLVTGVGDLLTDLVGSLVDVVLGEKQEDGTRSGGIIGLITDILSSLTGLINTNIGDFLSAVFSWLPTEFVTIFKAMLIFGIFFSIWKMIRG